MRRIPVSAALAVLCLPCVAAAQDARQILDTARQIQLERWEGVDAYVVEQSIMGSHASTWFLRTEVEQEDGETGTVFLPMAEVQLRRNECGLGKMTPEGLEAYAAGAEMTGDAVATEIESGLEQAGLPSGLLAATGSDPWNTMDPRVMMGGNADFLRAAAQAERQLAEYDHSADARARLDHMSTFMEKARVVGKETVEDRNTWHIQAAGINQVQKADDQEFRMETISLYVDTEQYVPLMMRVDGTMVSQNESRPMTIEIIQTDYRTVPGSKLYESYRQVMKMSGVLTAEQEAQLREAQGQMAEMEQQLASMPPDQRQMVENMMRPQLEMMRNMAAGGGYQSEVVVNNIRVNPELPGASGQPCPQSQAATTAVPAQGGDDVTRMVQEHLTTLGYNTGNTNGELSTQTVVAISQFQAENDMPVTGEASPQLAGILAAKVSSQASPPTRSPAELQAAQQACLQEKMAEAQEAQKKKRGFGRLMSGVSRLAGQTGNYDIAQQTGEIYQAGATAEDFAQAAKDLGLTEDDVAACENPI